MSDDPEKPPSAVAQRDASTGKFLPGNSANPGGRSKVQRDIQAALEVSAARAHEVINACLDDEDPKVRLAAARDVLDRVIGKAAQRIDVTATEGLLRALLERPAPPIPSDLLPKDKK